MSRKASYPNINKVTFTYNGSDEDLTIFLTAVIKDYLIKNKMIDSRSNIPIEKMII